MLAEPNSSSFVKLNEKVMNFCKVAIAKINTPENKFSQRSFVRPQILPTEGFVEAFLVLAWHS